MIETLPADVSTQSMHSQMPYDSSIRDRFSFLSSWRGLLQRFTAPITVRAFNFFCASLCIVTLICRGRKRLFSGKFQYYFVAPHEKEIPTRFCGFASRACVLVIERGCSANWRVRSFIFQSERFRTSRVVWYCKLVRYVTGRLRRNCVNVFCGTARCDGVLQRLRT